MKKTGLLFVALVLALGSLGVAYAAWTDEVTVEGSVDTGSLCWYFSSCTTLDAIPPDNDGGDYPVPEFLADYGCNPGFEPNAAGEDFWRVDKNVAWGDCEISDDGKTVTITVENAYPCYFNAWSVYMGNCGTVPLKFDHAVLSWMQEGVEQTVVIDEEATYLPIDYDGDGVYELELHWGNSFGFQLEPGGRPFETSFWLHLLQPAPQNDTLEFTMSLVAVQWDKYPLSQTEPSLVG